MVLIVTKERKVKRKSIIYIFSCSLYLQKGKLPTITRVVNLTNLLNGELMVEFGVSPPIKLVVGGPPGLSARE